MKIITRKTLLGGTLLFSMGLFTSVFAQGVSLSTEAKALYNYQMNDRVTPKLDDNNISVRNIYQTPADGCYYGIGNKNNTYNPMGIDCDSCLETGGKLKKNGSYVWGMVSYEGKLYWSTNNNYLCMPGYGAIATTGGSGAYENSCWVCEYDKGIRKDSLGVYGDIMKPRIFQYDPATGVVRDITPDDKILDKCQGLRSAAAHKGVVFFGGPSIVGGSNIASGGSAFVAYSPKQDKFIGSSDMSSVSGCKVTNVRKWIVINDVLYCGVGIKDPNGVAKGAVLRWNGDENNPFDFEVVGYTEGDAAEVEYHQGRIYVGGWPNAGSPSGIYRSPLLPENGFTHADLQEWESVWRFSDYEIDPSVYQSTYFSVLKSFKGHLYWGMFSGTYGVLYKAYAKFGRIDSDEAISYILGSLRSTTLFSATDFSSKNDVELLYGEKKLPIYNSEIKGWKILPNASGYIPKWGRSGYGNLFTCYTWSMAIYKDKLYIGTMDMSDLIKPATEALSLSLSSTLMSLLKLDESKDGYECLVIEDHEKEPVLITENGYGNPAAYGIRNMAICNDELFLGTANPQNLHENGGWEIVALNDHSTPTSNTFVPKEATIQYQQTDNYVEFASLSNEIINNIILVDMSGRMVRTVQPQSTQGILVTGDLASGAYIARVATPSETKSIKLVIK